METGSPSHTIGRDSVRIKDSVLHFIRNVVLILTGLLGNYISTTQDVLCCFDCIYHSLLPGQENESCDLHLKSQTRLLRPTAAGELVPKHGLCDRPLPLQQTQSPKPGRAAVLHAVSQALLCSCISATGEDITVPRLCKMLWDSWMRALGIKM